MFASNGILFNHESPRRGPTFVTRKISRAVAKIHRNKQNTLYLGNLDAKRDWGHAKDYVEGACGDTAGISFICAKRRFVVCVGMWLMLQAEKADDFVLATNETHPVREYVERAFAFVGITVEWLGERGTVDEIGVDAADHSRVLVRVDPKYFRPTEVDILIGDAAKAEAALGWKPKTLFTALVDEMVAADIADIDKGPQSEEGF
jgi:GDPmannose 4,6-dehydratase